MSLIQSAKLSGHDPNAYLKDVLERLPTQRAGDIGNCRYVAKRPIRALRRPPVRVVNSERPEREWDVPLQDH
jgi:hypothetical protein